MSLAFQIIKDRYLTFSYSIPWSQTGYSDNLLNFFFLRYLKVASSDMSCLEAHEGFFSLFMKGIFDPFDKKLIS
jgi:hypothetical protein